jgi:hypothetical protein
MKLHWSMIFDDLPTLCKLFLILFFDDLFSLLFYFWLSASKVLIQLFAILVELKLFLLLIFFFLQLKIFSLCSVYRFLKYCCDSVCYFFVVCTFFLIFNYFFRKLFSCWIFSITSYFFSSFCKKSLLASFSNSKYHYTSLHNYFSLFFSFSLTYYKFYIYFSCSSKLP